MNRDFDEMEYKCKQRVNDKNINSALLYSILSLDKWPFQKDPVQK